MRERFLACVAAASVAPLTSAAPPCVDSVTLEQYQLTATINLPAALVPEASAIAFNWDTGTLFVVGDGGPAVIEISRAGALLSSMPMSGFEDVEGLAYLGGGKFVIAEERIGRGYLFTYSAGGTLLRSALPNAPIGPNTGTNSGIEGITYDPIAAQYFSIKEKTPQSVYEVVINFAAGTGTYSNLFAVTGLGTTDLAEVLALATVPSLQGTPDQDNLLLLSQESVKLVKVSRAGALLGSLSTASMSPTMEGVTMDNQGVIYMCDDAPNPRLFVLTPGAVDACPCGADVNEDGTVDGADLGVMLAVWGPVAGGGADATESDLNHDGQVDGADLGMLLAVWGGC